VNLVFDSSALIAYLEDEPGADVVEELLFDRTNASFVHSINMCEVYYGARRGHGEEAAQATVAQMPAFGISIREDMDEVLWQEAGRFKADYKRISLADCFCAALANRIDGEVITADREYQALSGAGLCRVRFIR
jgi:PIN domain nuclease of toxin-antitoxin system